MNIRQKYKKTKSQNKCLKFALDSSPEAKEFYNKMCSPVKVIESRVKLQKIKIRKALANPEALRHRDFFENEIMKELLLCDEVKRQIEWEEDFFDYPPTIEASIYIGVKGE